MRPLTGRRELTVDEYLAGVTSGDMGVLARALTLVESHHPRHVPLAEQLVTRVLPHTGRSVRVGITGVPGVGKSTFIEVLGMHLIQCGKRVAVLAVDPSSGISGGSILGDKTRMPRLSVEPNAFIRPSPSAGTLGGVARKSRESLLLCEAAGYDVLLVETVGVGQSETLVADMTDCFLALMLPGAGDELQGIKRGLLEIVNFVAVNKADGATRTTAELAAHQYRLALQLLAGRTAEDTPAVFTCSALMDEGIKSIWQAIEQRQEALIQNGRLAQIRSGQQLQWLWQMVHHLLIQIVQGHPQVQAIRDSLEDQVIRGVLPASAAARRILAAAGLATADAS